MLAKVLIFGAREDAARELAEKSGFTAVAEHPDFVISYGGDGTLMRAEHAFPGVPKIVLKGSAICKKCASLPNEEILRRVAAGEYAIEEMLKLEAACAVGGRQAAPLRALNDVIVHNGNPRHAIRYRLWIDERRIGGEVIGDGVVIATPFGSTAYYRSITDSFFETGIGLAFNNSTEQSDHIVFREDRAVTVEIARGPAVVYADNQDEAVELGEGDRVIVQKSKETAKIVKV